MSATRIDTLRKFETPEGVLLDLRVAGPAPRALAWLIDFLIRIAALMLVGIVAGILSISGIGEAIQAIAVFVVFWLYHVLCEVLWNGGTPGKHSMGLRVVHTDGTPVGWSASAARNFLRVADQMPSMAILFSAKFWMLPVPTYGLGLVMIMLDARGQRLGDRVGGTLVVYHERKPRPRVTQSGVEPWSPPIPLLATERRALLDFAERRPTWTIERQIELTDQLEPITGFTGKRGLDRALSLVAHLEDQR